LTKQRPFNLKIAIFGIKTGRFLTVKRKIRALKKSAMLKTAFDIS